MAGDDYRCSLEYLGLDDFKAFLVEENVLIFQSSTGLYNKHKQFCRKYKPSTGSEVSPESI